MAVQMTQAMSGFARYAWIVFVVLGAFFILSAAWPATTSSTGVGRQYFLDFILIHVLFVVIAVFGLRRGERWAWYAMALWPLWLIVHTWTGGCGSFICSWQGPLGW